MLIAIIGAGNVGMSLGTRWAAAGHTIRFGARNPQDTELINRAAECPATVHSIAEACTGAETVVLATPWSAVNSAVEAAGKLSGKVIIDVTNPLKPGLQGLVLGTQSSAAEKLARLVPDAHVVKAFNSTGAENMRNPQFGDQKALMLVCADDDAARTRVLELASAIGFDAVDAGPLSAARYLEPMAMMWIHLAFKQGLGRDFAFGLLRR